MPDAGTAPPRIGPHLLSAKQIVDRDFLDARGKLVEIAAFLDRVERREPTALQEFRVAALTRALVGLQRPGADRAERVLLALSDPTSDPIPSAGDGKAVGAPTPP